MKIIITRPEEDARPLAGKLQAMGHHVSILSMMNIVPRNEVKIPDKIYQAICLTSANGVRSLRGITHIKDFSVIAVGPQSLQAAQKAGFNNVTAQGGDVDGLIDFVKQNYLPTAGPILYISGSETSGDLEGKLISRGFSVDRIITYDAVPAKLTDHQTEISDADAVMLYSPRSAKIWCDEIARLGLQNIAREMTYYCLAASVAARLPQSWSKIIALEATETSLLAALEQNRKAE
jgi:uroporphyrinogen-III synthase